MDHHSLRFFKIISANALKRKTLMIPIKYVADHDGRFSEEATLILPNCQSWKVGLTQSPQGLCFDRNWDEFVEHFSIREGQFLVFGFKSLSIFEVFIMDPSGCEIEYPSSATSSQVHEAVGAEDHTERKCSKRPASPKQKKTGEVEKNLGHFDVGYRATYQSSRAIFRSRKFRSENPFFRVVLRDSNFNCSTYFPNPFSKKYMSGLSGGHVKLVSTDEREWSLKVNRKRNGRLSFGGGWTSFQKENQLKKEDVCIFELVKKNIFRVFIFRD